MDAIAAVVVFVFGIGAGSLLLSRARKRAEYEDAVMVRLARFAGRRQ